MGLKTYKPKTAALRFTTLSDFEGVSKKRPERGLIAIGSGGAYAQAAASALLDNTELDAETVVRKALAIAGDICIYTNQNHTVETLG